MDGDGSLSTPSVRVSTWPGRWPPRRPLLATLVAGLVALVPLYLVTAVLVNGRAPSGPRALPAACWSSVRARSTARACA